MRLTLRIPRELVSPNQWNGRHWRVKHRMSQEWEWDICAAAAAFVRTNRGFAKWKLSGVPPERRRVAIAREVPSGRNFIRDDDNLRFSVKPLLDALKRQGFISNDSRKWIELPTPEQKISADGGYWTEIQIEACA